MNNPPDRLNLSAPRGKEMLFIKNTANRIVGEPLIKEREMPEVLPKPKTWVILNCPHSQYTPTYFNAPGKGVTINFKDAYRYTTEELSEPLSAYGGSEDGRDATIALIPIYHE